ncbi:hypothetical protein Tco_0016930 [Tanacetum coccineum]
MMNSSSTNTDVESSCLVVDVFRDVRFLNKVELVCVPLPLIHVFQDVLVFDSEYGLLSVHESLRVSMHFCGDSRDSTSEVDSTEYHGDTYYIGLQAKRFNLEKKPILGREGSKFSTVVSYISWVSQLIICGDMIQRKLESFVSFREMITSQLQGKLWLYDEVLSLSIDLLPLKKKVMFTGSERAHIMKKETLIFRVLQLMRVQILIEIRVSKGFSGVITPLFDTMLVQHQGEEPSIQTTPETSPSKITSSPSLSIHHTSISSPSTSQPPITPTEEAAPHAMSHLFISVHSLGDGERGHMKKFKKTVKTIKARRKARVVLSEDEDAAEDSSKQGRKIYDIDTDPTISLVQPQQDMNIELMLLPILYHSWEPTAGLEISTANIAVSIANAAVTTASASISTVSPLRVSTAEDISGAETLVYIRRSTSKAKDKGKAIMQESELPKKIKKKVQVQMNIDEELAKKVFEEEQAKFKAEQEQEKFDFETA